MKQIPLTQGKFALVDDEDYEYLNQWKWHIDNYGYAVRLAPRPSHTPIRMSRVIAETPKGMWVDHANRDRLDNRRCNLRNCTPSQNLSNSVRKNKSGFRGVYYHKSSGTWHGETCFNGVRKSAGYYKTPEEAARAYDKLAKEMQGEFASLNFPEQS
jgi:hypothetical protein